MVVRGNVGGAKSLLELFTLDDGYLDIIEEIVRTYKSERQHWATIQEMGELAQEISKIEMGVGRLPKAVEEEIADVFICLLSLMMIHDPKEISRAVNRKLDREARRLDFSRGDAPIGVDEHVRKKESSQEAAPGEEGGWNVRGQAEEETRGRKPEELKDPEPDLGV